MSDILAQSLTPPCGAAQNMTVFAATRQVMAQQKRWLAARDR